MKKRLLSMLLVLMMALTLLPTVALAEQEAVSINETNFPHPAFRTYVSGFDTNEDDSLSGTEINAVTEIDVVDKGITSLKGVEYFTELTTLNCTSNSLTSLNVSKNTKLETLVCKGNDLASLDVSKNTKLETLNCSNNKLTSLDVSANTALKNLHCDSNKLTSLDVSKNTALTELRCVSNNLTSLDVSKNKELTILYFDYNALTSLDVSANTALNYLHCDSNKLTSLDVSKNTALYELNCYKNELTVLDMSNNTKLLVLTCHFNRLTSLDVSKNTKLTTLNCNNNRLTSLDVSNNTELTSLKCSTNNLTSLDVSNNRNLNTLNCSTNNLTSLDVSKNTKLTTLNCKDNSYYITLPADKTFDLNTLPGFVVGNALNFVGGTVDKNILTFGETADEVTYNYACGYGKTANFKLISRLNLADSVAYDIPAGIINTTYTSTTPLTATGGTGQYTFTIENSVDGLSINSDNQLVYERPAAPTAAATATTIKVTDSADTPATATIEIAIGEVTDVPVKIIPTEDGNDLTLTVTDTSILGPTDLILVARYDGDGRMVSLDPFYDKNDLTISESGGTGTRSISKDGAAQVKAFLLKGGAYAPICGAAQWLAE